MRKLKLVILSVLLLVLPLQIAKALGLGEIEVYSALNQSLEAEIELKSVRPGETDGMLIKLASEQAFLQAGVERPFFLTKLQFTIALKPDGTAYIKVTTKDPIREPFLNFLVDVDWPRGRLVREYTVLLDPPVFATRQRKEPADATVDSQVQDPALPEIDTSVASESVLAANESDQAAALPNDSSVAKKDQTFTEYSADTSNTALDEPLEDDSSQVNSGDEATTKTKSASDDKSLTGADTSPQENIDSTVSNAPASTESTAEALELENPLDQSTASASLPDIDIELDTDIPYDADTVETLLAQFAEEDAKRAKTSATVSASLPATADKYGPVRSGDTLWGVTEQIRPEGVSLNQAMLAILRHNPEAFIKGNINSMRKGVVLRMPDKDAMLAMNSAEALNEVRRQSALWQEYKGQFASASKPTDKVASATASATPKASSVTKPADSAKLAILSPGRDSNAVAVNSGKQDGTDKGKAVYKELLLAQEALEAERLEKVELQSRLKEVEGQVSMMQRLISLKDQQLAELQSKLKQLQAQAAATAAKAKKDAAVKKAAQSEQEQHSAESVANKPNKQKPEIKLTPQPENKPAIDQKTNKKTPSEKVLPNKADTAAVLQEIDSPVQQENIDTEETDVAVEHSASAQKPEKTETDNAVESKPKRADSIVVAQQKSSPSGLAGFLYEMADSLPFPLNDILKSQLESPYGLYLVIGLPVLLLILLLWRVFGGKESAGKTQKVSAVRVPAAGASVARSPSDKKPSLLQKILAIFKKKKAAGSVRSSTSVAASRQAFPAVQQSMGDTGEFAAYDAEDVPPVANGQLQGAVFDSEKTQVIRSAVRAAADESTRMRSGEATLADADRPEEEVLDDTTAEADVYLAYSLFDQAEELLKQALKQSPERKEYMGKLLETYFSSGKKSEFEALAQKLKSLVGSRQGRIWEKTVAMGKEIAPENALFKDADTGRYKASDFAPAKPETPDIDLGGSDTSTTPDLDLGSDDSDVTLNAEKEARSARLAHDTIITPLETALNDDGADLEFDLSEADETEQGDVDFDMDLDFDAGDLGLDDGAASPDQDEEQEDKTISALRSDLKIGKSAPRPGTLSEETVVLDMDMELGELDLGSIDDTDFDLVAEEKKKGSATKKASFEDELDFNIDSNAATDLDLDFMDMSPTKDNKRSAGDELLAEMDEALNITTPRAASLHDIDILGEGEDDEETFIDDEMDDTSAGDGGDEVGTKLDLARAYIDMGDHDGASSTLEEVLQEGTEAQRKEAESLLRKLAR